MFPWGLGKSRATAKCSLVGSFACETTFSFEQLPSHVNNCVCWIAALLVVALAYYVDDNKPVWLTERAVVAVSGLRDVFTSNAYVFIVHIHPS